MKPNKLFTYDNPITSTFKTAYESKITSKIGVTTMNTNKNSRRVDEPKKVLVGNDRPQSANIIPQRKKAKNIGEDLIITNNIGKKRYPSSNAR